MVVLRGKVVVHEEQVAHLLGVGLPVQAREARLVQPAQPRCFVFRQGDRLAGAVGHGQRHCGRVHGVEVQVRDPADRLLGVAVLLAQLGLSPPMTEARASLYTAGSGGQRQRGHRERSRRKRAREAHAHGQGCAKGQDQGRAKAPHRPVRPPGRDQAGRLQPPLPPSPLQVGRSGCRC